MSQLKREIRQNRPFRSRSQEASLGLFRTADLLRRRFHAVLEPKGITQQQYNVLRILRGAGDGGLPTLTIAERMVERTPGITRLLDRLERPDRARYPCHHDRKGWHGTARARAERVLGEPGRVPRGSASASPRRRGGRTRRTDLVTGPAGPIS